MQARRLAAVTQSRAVLVPVSSGATAPISSAVAVIQGRASPVPLGLAAEIERAASRLAGEETLLEDENKLILKRIDATLDRRFASLMAGRTASTYTLRCR